MKLFLSKLLPLFTAGVILLCSVFALVPIESFADSLFLLPSFDHYPSESEISSSGSYFDSRYWASDSNPATVCCYPNPSGGYSLILVSLVNRSIVYMYWPAAHLWREWGLSTSSNGCYYFNYTTYSSAPSGIPVFSSLDEATRACFDFLSATPTPEPTPTPTPAPTSVPAIDDFFRPFRSFSGAYYNSSAIYPPDSLTLNKYQQYTGLVSNKPIRVTDVRSNIDFLDDKVVYKFEYDFRAGATDSFDISVLYDADNIFGYDYAYITVGGETFDGYALSQSPLTGTYRVFGNADVPEALQGYTNWSWEHDLVNQNAISISGINLSVDDRVTLTVIVASSTLPHIPSSFDWSQFFQDTRPDNVFLATTGGLAALPFFISGLSFLALGALIGIILKFMR